MEELNATNELMIGIEFGNVARGLLIAAGVELNNDIEKDFVAAVERELLVFESAEDARVAFGGVAAIAQASRELQDA